MIPLNSNGRLRHSQGFNAERFSVLMRQAGADRMTWSRVLKIEQGLLPPTKAEARLWSKFIPGAMFCRTRPAFKRRKKI